MALFSFPSHWWYFPHLDDITIETYTEDSSEFANCTVKAKVRPMVSLCTVIRTVAGRKIRYHYLLLRTTQQPNEPENYIEIDNGSYIQLKPIHCLPVNLQSNGNDHEVPINNFNIYNYLKTIVNYLEKVPSI